MTALVPIALAGAALGAINAAGLLWTVGAVARGRRPATLLPASFAVRTVVTLGPVALLADGRGDRLLAGLAAFVVSRLVAVRALASAGRLGRTEASP